MSSAAVVKHFKGWMGGYLRRQVQIIWKDNFVGNSAVLDELEFSHSSD